MKPRETYNNTRFNGQFPAWHSRYQTIVDLVATRGDESGDAVKYIYGA